MANLFGDPFNIQGNQQNLQGGYGGSLQPAGNPQQVYGPVPVVKPAPAPAPVAARPAPRAQKPAPAPRIAPKLTLDPTGLVGGLYGQYIGARPSPINPGVAEFYRKDTGQALDERGLFEYANSLGLGQVTSFEHLKANGNVQTAGSITNGNPAIQLAEIDPNQSLAEAAAQAGLNLDDYLKLVSSQYGITEEEKNSIKQRLGIDKLEEEVFKLPSQSTEQLYQDAYNTAGLGILKAKIDAKIKEISDRENQYADKANEKKENPWLSEATLTGRLKTLDDKRLADIGNLNNELQQLTDLYNNGTNEVGSLVARQTQDFSANQQINSQKLQYLLGKAEQQIATAQSQKQAGAYQYLPAYLKAKAKAQKPDTIGSEKTGYYRWNPDTGTFEQVIAPVTPEVDVLDTIYKQLQIEKLQKEIAGGGDANELLSANDALTLGVPYGTTKGQAASMNITPQKPLTGEALNKKTSLDVLDSTVGYLESLGEKLNWKGVGGTFKGSISQFLAKNFGTGTKEEQQLRSLIGNVQATIAKERGGTSFTPNEQALLEQYTPTINDSPLVIQAKLENLKQFIRDSKSALGQGAGTQQGDDPSDPLGLFKEKGGGVVGAISQKYPEGSTGGQCGDFAHKLVKFPPVGDSKSQKIAAVQKYGIPADQWRKNVRVGDVIITGENPTYGHVAVVNAVLPNGKIQLSESNYKQSNKISHDRAISVNSSQIYGAIRGSLKIA